LPKQVLTGPRRRDKGFRAPAPWRIDVLHLLHRPVRLAFSVEAEQVPAMPSFVYVLATTSGSGRMVTYVGWTLDLERRLAEHNGANKKGAKSTRGRGWALVYAEKHRTRKGAMRREYQLKHDNKFRAALRE
jgi:putative endonuclease